MAVGERRRPGPGALRHAGAWTPKRLRRAERGGGKGKAKNAPPPRPPVSFDWVDVLAASELAVISWGAHYHNAKSYLRDRDELVARLAAARARRAGRRAVAHDGERPPELHRRARGCLAARYEALGRAVEVADRSVVDFTWNSFGEFDSSAASSGRPGAAAARRGLASSRSTWNRSRGFARLHALGGGEAPPSAAAGAAHGAGRACAIHGADCLHWSGPWMGFHLADLMFNVADAMASRGARAR